MTPDVFTTTQLAKNRIGFMVVISLDWRQWAARVALLAAQIGLEILNAFLR
jgi:hypothetical protein